MEISELHKIFLKYFSISTDSRTIKQNDIFWALQGENFNGNKYAEKAIESGASYAIIDDIKYHNSGKTILVNDSLKTLQELANYHRNQLKTKIIAVTGTNGKTTTKELITCVLKKKYKIASTKGNLNNHIGVPLTLLSMNKDTEIGIVEMGANHPGEIKLLCETAHPNFGMITNIGKAHLEGFRSFEGLKKAKAELYDYLKTSSITFINNDNEILTSLNNNKNNISYGTEADCFCKGKLISAEPYVNLKINLSNEVSVYTKLIGSYNFENILAAACIGKYFDISEHEIKQALEEYVPDNNRSQIIKKGSSTIILDAYNANPSSMFSAIQNFKNIKSKNKVIILGDMFELGPYSEEEHLEICELLKKIKEEQAETKIFLAGDEFYNIVRKFKMNKLFTTYQKTEQLPEILSNFEFKNTWMLIKGSRGMKMETVIESLNAS